MKILDLPLKAKWYDMIESGEKREEYREIKPFWCKRLTDGYIANSEITQVVSIKHFTHVRFRYGYTKRTMLFEIADITIGRGNPDWGAPNKDVFIIKLGKRIE